MADETGRVGVAESEEERPSGPDTPRLGPLGLQQVIDSVQPGPVRGWRRMPLRGKIAIGWLLALVVIAVFAPWLVPGANNIGAGPLTAPPSLAHWFGTDTYGRDEFSRVIVGARISLLVAAVGPLLPAIIGGTIGIVAALGTRYMDEGLMRLMDIQFAFPAIVLALVLALIAGPSLKTTLIVMALVYTPIMARFVRAEVKSQFAEEYAIVARAAGATRAYVVRRHLAKNFASPLLVFYSLVAADAVLLEAALSFLGAGVQPPTPTWGNMLFDGSQTMLDGTWWLTLFPGLAIFSLVLALNTLSEAIADRVGGADYAIGKR